MSVLTAENITYIYQSKYQKVQALTDVSCDFEAGKFYAIVGRQRQDHAFVHAGGAWIPR